VFWVLVITRGSRFFDLRNFFVGMRKIRLYEVNKVKQKFKTADDPYYGEKSSHFDEILDYK